MLLSKATCGNSHIHSHTDAGGRAGAAHRSSLGFSLLPKGTWTCRPGESKSLVVNNEMMIKEIGERSVTQQKIQME